MKKLILSILFILCLSFQASAWNPMVTLSGTSAVVITTPTYRAFGSCQGSCTDWGTTATASITVVSGSNQCIIAYAISGADRTFSGATYDGNAMTLIVAEYDGNREVAMYQYCTAPLGTGAKDVVVTISSDHVIALWAAQFDGVKISDPINTFASDMNTGADPNDISVTVDTTGQDNCLLVSGVSVSDSTETLAVDGTGQTLLGYVQEPGTIAANGGYFDKATAGSQDQDYTSSGTWTDLQEIVIALNPAGS